MDRTGYGRLAGLALTIVLGWCLACEGRILCVDGAAAGANDGSSWANACTRLQDAMAVAKAAGKPVEIRVARGVYKPDQGTGITPGDQGATFQLLNGVTLKGGYAGAAAPDPNARDIELYETILSGDLKEDDALSSITTEENSCRVVTASSGDETAVIDGFTITGGGASWGPCGDEYGSEGGIVIDGGSPVIRACHFTTNRQYEYGVCALSGSKMVVTGCLFDGQGMLSLGSSPVLTDCVFTHGGVTNDAGSSLSLTNCRFDQAGIGSHDSHLALANCSFRGNKYYAVEARDNNSVITDCFFERNGQGSMNGGAIESFGGVLTLEDCRFVENRGTCIRSIESADSNLIRCSFTANKAMGSAAIWTSGSLVLHECEFIGNSSQIGAGAIHADGDQLKAMGCLFAGNSTEMEVFASGAILSTAILTRLSHCTFVGNRGSPNTMECLRTPAELTSCIVWNGPDPFTRFPLEESKIKVTYSDVQGGYPGEGNIDVDPCFVEPGYRADPNDTSVELGPDDPNAVWVNGDYHSKSQAGHWDRSVGAWVRDEVTSACIDAGDPNAPIGSEPFPNGGVVNLGAYGGTSEASKSYFGEPVCETQIAGDINGDCKVDQTDMDILLSHWLTDAADLVNSPPTVTLTAPEDGEVFDYPAWVNLYADAVDSDGWVVRVKFFMQYTKGGQERTAVSTDSGPSNGWGYNWQWWGTTGVPFEGSCVLWAEAMDNDGAVAVSPKITITLHVTN